MHALRTDILASVLIDKVHPKLMWPVGTHQAFQVLNEGSLTKEASAQDAATGLRKFILVPPLAFFAVSPQDGTPCFPALASKTQELSLRRKP